MNIEVILAFSMLLIGTLTYAILRKPSKIEDVRSWGFKSIENAQITFKKLIYNQFQKKNIGFAFWLKLKKLMKLKVSFHSMSLLIK